MLGSMSLMPEFPDLPNAAQAEAAFPLRYEDLCQDGRMMTIAMPVGLGVLWRKGTHSAPIWELRKQGTVPILAHLWISATEEPMHLTKPARCLGKSLVAHTLDAEGEVNRLLLDMKVDLYGTRGRVFGSQPEGAGEEVLVGSVYARHVFTRPFAPREERRVKRFEHSDLPEIPDICMEWSDPESFQSMPEGASILDAEARQDEARVAFGLHQCDSNQHVNSLAYPRLFEDAAQRRFAEHTSRTTLSREVAIAFRKPYFAGQRARVHLQSFESEGALGVIGGFYPDDDEKTVAHCHMRMLFR
jgi:acyl-CoA thioesterase FadM